MAWLSANLVNIVLIAVIAAVVILIIRGMIRDEKNGKCSCGGDCGCCGLCAAAADLPKNPDELKARSAASDRQTAAAK